MNVLVCCEESQEVCFAFRCKGHNAFSCDLQSPSGGFPEFHILGDCLSALYNSEFRTMDGFLHCIDKWDLVIAHPPCTFLSNAGARHLWKGHQLNLDRYEKGIVAKRLFIDILSFNCDKICIENPVPSSIFGLPKYSQIIQPYQFGHPYSKRTCLWLKGLPLLFPTSIVEPVATWCPSGSYSHIHNNKYRGMFTTDRAKNRAKTFSGIAAAMADQWG